MRFSSLFGRTLREAPSDAEHIGYQLAVRTGLARQLQAGSFALMPLGMKAFHRIEAIIHDEMQRIGAQEFRTPLIQATSAWEQTGRLAGYGELILRMQDRSQRDLLFAPTHEEAVSDLARREIASYRQMPALVYQITTKYRDETRTKGGLMRLREFSMLDIYSLDADAAGLDQSYDTIAAAFERIFQRCGLQFLAVEASNGEMGGSGSREYMVLSPAGEDTLAICPSCGYAANSEVASAAAPAAYTGEVAPMRELETPNCTTIADVAAFVGVPTEATAKAVFFDSPERGLIFVVIRGDREVNEDKVKAAAQVSRLAPATLDQIVAAGAVAGYASPVGLQVQPAEGGEGVFVLADRTVAAAGGLVAGANKTGYHLIDAQFGRDWQASVVADVAQIEAGDPCAACGTALTLERGIELGHIFKLGTRYTETMGTNFLDVQGKPKPIVMGSYGIGLERLLQIVLEQHHDERGVVWPDALAPALVHLVRIGKGEEVRAKADALYAEFLAAGISVLYDDREDSAGIKFNDADLIGLPLRVVVSERLLADQVYELKPRNGEAQRLSYDEMVQLCQARCAGR